MRFWLLKQAARLLGLQVQMMSCANFTPASALSLRHYYDAAINRHRSIRGIVLATDALTVVEMMHMVALSTERDGSLKHDFAVQ